MSNSPHVLFFRPIIKELEKRGHKVIITTREHAQTKQLLDLFGMKYTLIGKHAGKSIFKKLLNAISRVFELSSPTLRFFARFYKNLRVNTHNLLL